jgi:hypothetical protein
MSDQEGLRLFSIFHLSFVIDGIERRAAMANDKRKTENGTG